jgi:hypothetical protein
MYQLLKRPDCPAFQVGKGKKWIIPAERFDEWMFALADEKAEKMEAENARND